MNVRGAGFTVRGRVPKSKIIDPDYVGPSYRPRTMPGPIPSLLVLLLLVAGCGDVVIDPFIEGQHFTVYGFLNQFDDEHFVRVIAVRRFHEDIPTPTSPHAEIDGRVTSTNLTTGEQHIWSHGLVKLDDGNFGHVFRAAFVVNKGHRYELVVTRSDGARSVAQTTVPNLKDWRVDAAEIRDDTTTQTITWMGVSTPENITMSYCAKPVGGFSCNPVVVQYGRRGRRIEEGWEVDVQLSRDLQFVRQQLGVGETLQLELSSMDMLFTALDDKWILPEEPFDPQEFAQPDVLAGALRRCMYTCEPGPSTIDFVSTSCRPLLAPRCWHPGRPPIRPIRRSRAILHLLE